MLRRSLIGLSAAFLVLALVLWTSGYRVAALVPPMIWGTILLAGLVFERATYKRELIRPPGPGWVRTEEKSVDARGVVTVWFNPATGERAYVRAGAGDAGYTNPL
jgi:hypothetical protein